MLFIDLGFGKARMGGSAFGQVYNNMSGDAPDLDDAGRLKAFYSVIQQLVAEDKLLAYHDRSDGGLFATLAEMAFAARCGISADIDCLMDNSCRFISRIFKATLPKTYLTNFIIMPPLKSYSMKN
ncbi:phosphoribosylformylglycinamidine synthase [Neisseria gonorrhoeae]|uniref:Phosphoribosylformylglycinamidine synthase n=1 Tax=Neisseria gonorrhoeae TaxID=485 RepID=A0A378VV96_NEIGO|nr:phosphoribosylformylglycinamidine synthase [Neisseria gonorrhoeae]